MKYGYNSSSILLAYSCKITFEVYASLVGVIDKFEAIYTFHEIKACNFGINEMDTIPVHISFCSVCFTRIPNI